MNFSLKEYRDAFAEAYRCGMERAGPLSRETVEAMIAEINGLRERGDHLRADLKLGVMNYLLRCYGMEAQNDKKGT